MPQFADKAPSAPESPQKCSFSISRDAECSLLIFPTPIRAQTTSSNAQGSSNRSGLEVGTGSRSSTSEDKEARTTDPSNANRIAASTGRHRFVDSQFDHNLFLPNQSLEINDASVQAIVGVLMKVSGLDDNAHLPELNFAGDGLAGTIFASEPSFDRSAFNAVLQNRTLSERKQSNELFLKETGKSLEQVALENLSGSDLQQTLNIINRKDGDVASQRADQLQFGLTESRNHRWRGRSVYIIEKDFRDILSKSTASQITEINKDGVIDQILRADFVSVNTKEAIKILRLGYDRITDKQRLDLAYAALDSHDLLMFQEAMAKATPQARAEFRRNDGFLKISEAFKPGTIKAISRAASFQFLSSPRDFENALGYARFGKIDSATQISENIGNLITRDHEGIELGVAGMSAEERKLYETGKRIFENSTDFGPEEKRLLALGEALSKSGGLSSAVSDEQQKAAKLYEAKSYYDRLFALLEQTGQRPELEDKIINGNDGTIISRLALSHRGRFYNSSPKEIQADIQSMSEKDCRDGQEHPERLKQLRELLVSLGQSSDALIKTLQIYADKVKNSVRVGALDSARTAEPAVELSTQVAEHIALNISAQRDQGTFRLDMNVLAHDFIGATDEEKAALDTVSSYRTSTMKGFSKEQQEFLLNAARHGKLEDEDRLRGLIISHAGAAALLAELNQVQNIVTAEKKYAESYKSDLETDFCARLQGEQRREAQLKFASARLSQEELQDRAAENALSTLSGVGSSLTARLPLFSSASRSQLISALEQSNNSEALLVSAKEQQTIAEASIESQSAVLCGLLNQASEHHIEAKGAAVKEITSVATGALGIGSVVLSGGATIPLILGVAATSGVINAGTNRMVLGENAEYDSGSLEKDFAVGVVQGAFGVIGPGETATMFGIGKSVAIKAGQGVLKSVSKGALVGSLKNSPEETEKQIFQNLEDALRHAIPVGSSKLKPAFIEELAEKVVSKDATDRRGAVGEIGVTIQDEVQSALWQEEAVTMAQKCQDFLTSQAYQAGAGLSAGASGALTEGIFDGKNTREIMHDTFFESFIGGASSLGIGKVTRLAASGVKGFTAIPELNPLRDSSHNQLASALGLTTLYKAAAYLRQGGINNGWLNPTEYSDEIRLGATEWLEQKLALKTDKVQIKQKNDGSSNSGGVRLSENILSIERRTPPFGKLRDDNLRAVARRASDNFYLWQEVTATGRGLRNPFTFKLTQELDKLSRGEFTFQSESVLKGALPTFQGPTGPHAELLRRRLSRLTTDVAGILDANNGRSVAPGPDGWNFGNPQELKITKLSELTPGSLFKMVPESTNVYEIRHTGRQVAYHKVGYPNNIHTDLLPESSVLTSTDGLDLVWPKGSGPLTGRHRGPFADWTFQPLTNMTNRGIEKYKKYLEFDWQELNSPDSLILDIGAGAAQELARGASARGFASRIVSIDPGLAMEEQKDLSRLWQTEQNYRLQGRKQPHSLSIAAEGQALPFADSSVDRAYALFSLPFWAKDANQTNKFLSEMQRVVKPGGFGRIYPVKDEQTQIVEAWLTGNGLNLKSQMKYKPIVRGRHYGPEGGEDDHYFLCTVNF